LKVENGDSHSKENSNQNGAAQSNGHSEKPDADENENKIKKEIEDVNGPKTPTILFTGFVPSSLSEMERMARELGAKIVSMQNSTETTHMVMPKLGRTMAFLCGLSYAKYIVSSAWIEESSAAKQFLDEKPYALEDDSFDTKFGCDIRKTLNKKGREKLFEGRIFYLTPSIFPSWKKLKMVIEFAGGKVENKRRKDIEEIKTLNKPGHDPIYIIIACEHDLHIVADVLMAKIGIFNTEFVMSAVMRSKMDFDLTKSLTTV